MKFLVTILVLFSVFLLVSSAPTDVVDTTDIANMADFVDIFDMIDSMSIAEDTSDSDDTNDYTGTCGRCHPNGRKNCGKLGDGTMVVIQCKRRCWHIV
ncbi:hypothetical protein BDU57DRAFT_509473 [Ampelomyces quisqualis]|uniref:Invertebrate defensins family profile domain-containing protein n=1 Tax=Ampelomyces quisqualis TaxID=50730 RepID=A0A6A5QZQ5_AMPQU|nr:hypothetical protein BDU57DRAFT_509473 [Ampelomyces quisqualis]